MKSKIKKIVLGVVVSFSASPLIALAQWNAGLANAQQSGLPWDNIASIIGNIMFWILSLVGVVAIIGFAISGLMYLTSAGDDDQIKKAKNAMKNSIIGVIVALVGLVVIYAVNNMLGGMSDF
ncbi:MAG: hypothetical protein UR69_C0004G0006 [Candidatus Moranbacteria bacterium GW2011_GWE2_35_2-]|nr:MAG: hypothetical protein UR69_C0004G0006 [Candidatus Moranbacteria bacterium GW2011_GWE2_35_2-]KKQ22180.1 MAG: hypothetical protein US37_C0003G0006 [Candidatus Moranbacteria bacterium GW2011_GWF2_37_11]KKQ28764.1 MAG: hypothetical protein US44_C0007G0050 [Candidatus Moranbacteria bacterium GW2011_GWD1_37_17]KKQ30328.1 MAG: hypothetical protein US47_C0003G0123 [Candidatus Moranbacteria bacterium GW2011_GWE1_37_24]KKQ46660.1 MAG: hypothetical protein US66_C0033G0005 [Candidatus Moranbacteria 